MIRGQVRVEAVRPPPSPSAREPNISALRIDG